MSALVDLLLMVMGVPLVWCGVTVDNGRKSTVAHGHHERISASRDRDLGVGCCYYFRV